MLKAEHKVIVQNFGRFLSNMVMPNIGAFIAWGFITALFIPTGWWPNEQLASLVGPMITYLLPLLIGYTGGKMVGGDRGAVVGAITTMGVIVGSDIPMFMGAMMAGPLGGWAIKHFDKAIHGKVKSGFEMLVNNFSAGILGMLLALVAYFLIGPFVKVLSTGLAGGVNVLVENGLLPLTSIFVEPAKILFLNNAINHGIFTPLGIQQSSEVGKSIFFLIESNPGPGLGVLLAYTFFGRGSAKETAVGASVIHFFGGIHEIYFPYVLMNPRLLLAVIAGGMSGVFTLTLFNGGMISPASPGSIFAVLIMTPQSAIVANLLAVAAATTVSFVVAAVFVKRQAAASEGDDLDEAQAKMAAMKSGNAAPVAAASGANRSLGDVTHIVVACDAGMGSSAMGAGMLRKKVQQAGLNIDVTNKAINSLDEQSQMVITHKDLTDRAKKHATNAIHYSLTNFLDGEFYNQIVAQLQSSNTQAASQPAEVATQSEEESTFDLDINNIQLGLKANDKADAIRIAGEMLVKGGYAEPSYVDAMFERETLVSTYLGDGIAVPHGTGDAKDRVKQTGIVVCQYPNGVSWGEDEDDKAKLVIGIAAKGNDHIMVLTNLTNALDDPEVLENLTKTKDVNYVRDLLMGKTVTAVA